jgi:hypothetical protein
MEASMAEIRIQDGDIIVQLGSLEKIGALHGDVRVPRSAVIAMRVVENPFAEIQGIRFPGTGVPGLIALGTWRRGKARDFVCVYRDQPGVVIDIDPAAATYQRVIISSSDPNGVRKLLRK